VPTCLSVVHDRVRGLELGTAQFALQSLIITSFTARRQKSLVPKCSGKPRGSADVRRASEIFLKRHLRVRVLSPQPDSAVSADLAAALRAAFQHFGSWQQRPSAGDLDDKDQRNSA
jgi:hypothetical protein